MASPWEFPLRCSDKKEAFRGTASSQRTSMKRTVNVSQKLGTPFKIAYFVGPINLISMKLFLSLAFSATLSIGLYGQQTDVTQSFPFSPIDPNLPAVNRSYTVAIPSGYDPAVPSRLIVSLHGYSSEVTFNRESISLDSIAEANNVIVVYPTGESADWVFKPFSFLPNARPGWNAGIIEGEFDDVSFVSQVLDSVESQYNIDSTRIYCTGISNGAMLSMKVAAELGDRFAAAAVVIGFDSIVPTTSIPLLAILAVEDPIISMSGFPNLYPGWTPIESNWLSVNGCTSAFTSDTLPNLDLSDSTWVEKRTFSTCSSRGSLVEYLIHNGGHVIPKSGPCTSPAFICDSLGFITNDIDPLLEVWNFFNGKSTLSIAEETSTAFHLYPNPAKDHIIVEINAGQKSLDWYIRDLKGSVVKTGVKGIQSNQLDLDVSDLLPGYYLFQAEGSVKKFTIIH